jgi:hypothetical protein
MVFIICQEKHESISAFLNFLDIHIAPINDDFSLIAGQLRMLLLIPVERWRLQWICALARVLIILWFAHSKQYSLFMLVSLM